MTVSNHEPATIPKDLDRPAPTSKHARDDEPPAREGFDRCNLARLPLERVCAHEGEGTIGFHRILDASGLAARCNFIDYAVVPPGASIGRHRHARDEEELYLVLRGRASMWRDGESFRVGPGDLVRNLPGGAHGLVNDGDEDVHLFVIELPVADAAPRR